MKKILLFLLTIIIFIMPLSAYSEDIEFPPQEQIVELGGEEIESEIIEAENASSEEEQPQITEYDYEIGLDNLYKYNIVALNDAQINQHIRGSLWVGGTLTGDQYVDDGSINGVAASDSYVYNNLSQLNFKSRTQYQGLDSYYWLSYKAVENTRNFWYNIMDDLQNGDESFIYVEPDSEGKVDLKLWNYNAEGGDSNEHSFQTVYWTDATYVEMGGLAGHLIAPYADVHIVSCNHCGSIVGWNIYTDGEAHINSYVFDRPKPIEKVTPTPTPPAKITLVKEVIGNMWHVRCDIMDTTTFEAGGGIWKTDVISNPKGITSHEGHRSNKCGDAEHWVIWVDTEGNPYRMDEVKSGATGGTLPTVVYKPRYNLTTNEIQNMTSADNELVWKYSQNFIDPMPWSEIKIGERLYWTTTNDGQIWYHSGIPYESNPSFILSVDGVNYPIVANGAIDIEDLEPGIHEIAESPDSKYYLGEIVTTSEALTRKDEWTVTIEVKGGENVDIIWPNVVVTPVPTNSPTPPPTPNIPTATPTPTPTPTSRTTPPTTRPTPPSHIVPQTGDPGFFTALAIFIIALIGAIIVLFKRKH